ncbi:MAG TPA: hypothetical protein VGG72_05610 [Bryobacteraceae bacterium]|jgi:hypothetical protein
MRIIGMLLLVVGAAVTASAQHPSAPEIDANAASSALALLSGSLLILKSRRKK